eukprot:2485-Eustigmatos_ZCMA.PRE.1
MVNRPDATAWRALARLLPACEHDKKVRGVLHSQRSWCCIVTNNTALISVLIACMQSTLECRQA